MANPEHVAKLEEEVEAWNQWRESQTITPDLSGADFSGKDLSRADLRDVNFSESNLSRASLREANLQGAVLRSADLRGVNFSESNLTGASLRQANLQGTDLSVAKRGLQTEQLAGADLTGATLPEELKKLYDGLQNVNNISESARKLFLAVLAACLYSWLTIATTTDVNLITNRASSPLPIIQTSIPIVGFYVVAPLLLLCVYFYFHFYLQKLWEELGSLPAILPDGRPLHAKIDPWLLNDLVRAHLPKLNVNRPFLSYFQLWISVLLAWWVVPITMFLFWGRYLPCHEQTGTAFHVTLLTISLTAALSLYRLAVATLRGAERKPFRWRGILASRRGYQMAAFVVMIGVLFGVVSWGAIMGVGSDADILGISLPPYQSGTGLYVRGDQGPLTWVPRLMAVVGYSWFVDLRGAELSRKRATWSKNDKDADSVIGAQLNGANLRYALASRAFLAGANLDDADLSGADLTFAELKGSHLKQAHLRSAFLEYADLSDADLGAADLHFAQLANADLSNAILNLADLRSADLGNTHLSGTHLVGADLRGAQLAGADLTKMDLRANLAGAILVRAHLRDADLDGAGLSGADLEGADLSGAVLRADLSNADLRDADLSGARLTESDLHGARLNGSSNLTYTDFRGAKNLSLETLKGGPNWERAFYDDEMLKALGLPLDHNDKLAAQRKKQQELQKKQDAKLTTPTPAPPRQ